MESLVLRVTEALEILCQGTNQILQQRLQVFNSITRGSACHFGEHSQSDGQAGGPRPEVVSSGFSSSLGRSVDGEWKKPRSFAKPREACFDCCTLSGPQFFNLAAADAEVEHVSVSGEAVAGDSKGDWTSEGDQQAPGGILGKGTSRRGFSSPRGERARTRSGRPCEPGQSKGSQRGSQERDVDSSSHAAPQARDNAQRSEVVSQPQVQCEKFEQRGKHERGAQGVLVAQQEAGGLLNSPEVVIVEASPGDKPRGDGAQEQEAHQLCAAISELLVPLKPGVAVPAEVECKLVVLIERLEQAVPEHSPLWELGFSVCEALSDPWHALEAAQGLCANLIAEPSLHAEWHDGVLQQPVDGSSEEPTLPDPCYLMEQTPEGGIAEGSQAPQPGLAHTRSPGDRKMGPGPWGSPPDSTNLGPLFSAEKSAPFCPRCATLSHGASRRQQAKEARI